MIKLPKRKQPSAEAVIVYAVVLGVAVWLLAQVLKHW